MTISSISLRNCSRVKSIWLYTLVEYRRDISGTCLDQGSYSKQRRCRFRTRLIATERHPYGHAISTPNLFICFGKPTAIQKNSQLALRFPPSVPQDFLQLFELRRIFFSVGQYAYENQCDPNGIRTRFCNFAALRNSVTNLR
jgi:hypothetical protein